MKIQVLQNIAFEGPGHIEKIAEEKGHEFNIVNLYDGEQPLPATDYDMMVILGGPMRIYEESEYPWLGIEKKAIEYAIQSDKIILGICLGAQLIADVLGAEVYKNEFREIGWYPVTRTVDSPLKFFPQKLNVFHWHSETFDIPGNATRIFSSEATENQSFLYEDKVLAMQFHLEVTEEMVEDFIFFYKEDLEPGKFVMQKEKISRLTKKYVSLNRKILLNIFTHFLDQA